MYRTFYHLLEEITGDYLLIVNEFMRTKNRNDLTYNCLRHYLNQCGHTIVFEYFPFIEDTDDFMILFDFDSRSKYKGTGFQHAFLNEADILCCKQKFSLATIPIQLPSTAQDEYEKKRESLFENLGNKEPDTIPRQLHIFCGKWKIPYVDPEKKYVARNSRFKKANIITYPNVQEGEQYIMLDFLHKRLEINDYLRKAKQTELTFISTEFGADTIYIKAFEEWAERLANFYAGTGLYK